MIKAKKAASSQNQAPAPDVHRLRRGDLLLFAGFLALALLLFLGYRLFFRNPGAAVEIAVDGKAIKTLPLNQNTTYKITTGSQGSSHENILKIKDGYASITEADCPDKLCVHQKKISKKGETLVCLPHKVIVSVISPGAANELDGVAH